MLLLVGSLQSYFEAGLRLVLSGMQTTFYVNLRSIFLIVVRRDHDKRNEYLSQPHSSKRKS